MIQNFLYKLLLLAALTAVVAGRRCKVPVPFTTTLVGKLFTKLDDCFRSASYSEIRVNANTIVYKPLIIRTFFQPACVERYVFHLRRNGTDPFVAYFPTLSFPFPGNDFSVTEEELQRFCDKEHGTVREKYFPVGKTRKMFKESVRTMVKATEEVRDFACETNDEGFRVRVRGRGFVNVDLDGIVTYLLGVAYQYNFCAESK